MTFSFSIDRFFPTGMLLLVFYVCEAYKMNKEPDNVGATAVLLGHRFLRGASFSVPVPVDDDGDGGGLSTGAYIGIAIAGSIILTVCCGLLSASNDTSEGQRTPAQRIPTSSVAPNYSVAARTNVANTPRYPGEVNSVITVSAMKDTVDSKVGISFKQKAARTVKVSSVPKGSLFEATGLLPEMQVLRINGQPCPQNMKEAIKLVQEAQGLLTLTVKLLGGKLLVFANKENYDSKIGVGCRDLGSLVVISNIQQDSKFSGTALQVGMKVEAVIGSGRMQIVRPQIIKAKDVMDFIRASKDEVGFFVDPNYLYRLDVTKLDEKGTDRKPAGIDKGSP